MVYWDSEGAVEIETIQGDKRSWASTNLTYVQLDDKFYELVWEQGLTEDQDNEFWDQDAPEVKRVSETIVVNKWEYVE